MPWYRVEAIETSKRVTRCEEKIELRNLKDFVVLSCPDTWTCERMERFRDAVAEIVNKAEQEDPSLEGKKFLLVTGDVKALKIEPIDKRVW